MGRRKEPEGGRRRPARTREELPPVGDPPTDEEVRLPPDREQQQPRRGRAPRRR